MADETRDGPAMAAQITPGVGHVVLERGGEPAIEPDPERVADLYSLSDPALAELEVTALLDEVLSRIRQILEVDTVAVLLHDEERTELVARAAKGLEEEVRRGVRIPIGQGFAGRIAAVRAPIFIPDLRHGEVFNPILRDIGIQSLLGVPLIVEGQLIGVLHVGTLTPREFTAADAALLEMAASRVAPGIERARLSHALEREHRAAVALQRSLLPSVVPEIADVDVAVRYLPARDEVGGDWYDLLALPSDRVGIVIGDVVGHGVRAAALMAQVRTALRAYALDGLPPGAVLERLDRLMQTTTPTGMATVAFAVLEPMSGRLRLAAAGHPPAVIVDADGAGLLSAPVGPPLGVRPYPAYDELVLDLAYGETLLLYTDGLVEVRGEPLDVGLERLRATAAGRTAPEDLCQHVVAKLAGPSPDDDVAVVALARSRPPVALDLKLAAEPHVLAAMRRRVRTWLHAQGADEEEQRAIVLAVGEACANAIEHAYSPRPAQFRLRVRRDGDVVDVVVSDAGRWRAERSGGHRGRGLGIMRATMDEVDVRAGEDGTLVRLKRRLRSAA